MTTGLIILCNKIFKTRDDLRSHMQDHNNQTEWNCDICKKTFSHYYNYHHHLGTSNHLKIKSYAWKKMLSEMNEN
jgi:hypothetical protein